MKGKLVSVVVAVLIIIGIAVFGNIMRIQKVDVVFSENVPSAKADEIYDVLGIETGTSVLSVNETDFVTRVSNAYPDRSVLVVDVVRGFPDKMTVYIDYNPGVVAVPTKDGSGYVVTDTEFQSNTPKTEDELVKSELLILKGTAVGSSFNVDEFRFLYELFSSLKTAGLTAEKLPEVFSSLELKEGKYIFVSRRNPDKTLTVPESERGNAAEYYRDFVSELVG